MCESRVEQIFSGTRQSRMIKLFTKKKINSTFAKELLVSVFEFPSRFVEMLLLP